MATASGSEGAGFLGSPLRAKLEKDGFFISKLFDKVNDSHSHLVTGVSDEISNKSPVRFLLTSQEAKDLTNIKTKQQLKTALQIAVELEMTVMFEYLFACFSIINNSDEVNSSIGKDLNSYNSEIRREYKTQLMLICIQEMQHMSMAIDMLISIGGIPNLQKVQFPSKIGVDEEDADLIRLNLKALYMFAKNEEPYPHSEHPALTIIPPNLGKHFQYYSIAQLYEAIYKGFTVVHHKLGHSLFELNKHMTNMTQRYTTIKKVHDDIRIIETQGEGEMGGILFKDVITLTRDWVKSQKVTGDVNNELQQKIVELCDKILSELDNLEQLLPDIGLLIALISEFEKSTGLDLPVSKDEFLKLESIEPSHWARFLMMILNFSTLNESTDSKNDNFAPIVSRPSHPRPGVGHAYHPITQRLVDLTNDSYQILLMILEGSIIKIPEAEDKLYQITARYNSIRFYPIMSILIFPLGETLSYFMLSEEEPDKTAGFPFQTKPQPKSAKDLTTHPFEKFMAVVNALEKLQIDSAKFKEECYNDFDKCVGIWITDNETRKTIVNRVKYTLDHVVRSIEILHEGFSNGIPLQPPKPKTKPKPPRPMKEVKDKFYLNIEFDGYAIYSMATDYDPTYETRGFIGHQFMFEYSEDPNFTDEFYTQNTLKNCNNPFKRDYIPEKNYKGVKITSAKLIPPCYMTDAQLCETNFLEVQKAVEEEFFGNPELHDFCFYNQKIHGVEYNTKFQQLNEALSRQMGIDPINVGFETKSFKVKRANLIYNDKNEVVDYDSACTKYSKTFGVYSDITDSRTAKSGGYLQWDSTFNTINGLLANTNLMNSKCGAGQCLDDFYTTYKLRSDAIMKDIKEILDIPRYQADPLAKLIIPFLEHYPAAKLIALALMINLGPEDKNKLAYLCTRYLNVTYEISHQFKNSPFQCFYHIPLNAPLKTNEELFSVIENTSDNENLSRIKFLIDQEWYIDFWVGGYDYDALTFYMSGSLMIPVHVKPKP
ncbi:hypothetical protein LOD99_8382 [Oopsacas minuta]|uniref:Iminophenyl-pyruvate dimer synthase domain-containing protein n=1 Tax=Oopsacas minuta TaxID=111878 RepID=A0AAV7JHG8_9METZ|nr:hypothetical protein LOD99_8382 [Oopsacas minuta]